MEACVKDEPLETPPLNVNVNSRNRPNSSPIFPNTVIELSSSDSDAEEDLDSLINNTVASAISKPSKTQETAVVLPVGFLRSETQTTAAAAAAAATTKTAENLLMLPAPSGLSPTSLQNGVMKSKSQGVKQFWKAGDYEGSRSDVWDSNCGIIIFFFILYYYFTCFLFDCDYVFILIYSFCVWFVCFYEIFWE